MRKVRILLAIAILSSTASFSPTICRGEEGWKGVDETVVEKVAAEAGHPARKPYINTDQGDLLLFMFLLAGATGGFVGGYAFRSLFPPKAAAKDHAPNL
jgi:hypothetical protein